jgi:Icc-related predicted phosphoesterase
MALSLWGMNLPMRILSLTPDPVAEIRFLNAGKRPGQFYEDRLPILDAIVDALPSSLDALIATADLQGRERFQDSPSGPLRLLGEVLPEKLVREILPELGLNRPERIGVLLAGDFYTVPALDKRGGTGDVTSVWHAFGNMFRWVAGVAGNHDTFGDNSRQRPRFPAGLHYLDADRATIDGLSIAGIGGIIGDPARLHRRLEDDYLEMLEHLLCDGADLLLMHDGPDGGDGQRGSPRVREVLERMCPRLIIRGHAHWDRPLAELATGVQVLNVDARVVLRSAVPRT